MMAALKAGDKPRKEALSMLLSALKAAFIDKRADLTEDEENANVYREIKEAQETMDATPKDRTDIIDECRLKIAVYSDFAPQRMSDDEIRAVIAEVLKELDITKHSGTYKAKRIYLLSGKLFCGHCGYSMNASCNTNGYTYYECLERKV